MLFLGDCSNSFPKLFAKRIDSLKGMHNWNLPPTDSCQFAWGEVCSHVHVLLDETLVEPKMRIELTTYALRVRCSTPELPGRVVEDQFTPVMVFIIIKFAEHLSGFCSKKLESCHLFKTYALWRIVFGFSQNDD